MGRLLELAGTKWNHWTIEARAANASNGASRWHARCDCGTRHIVTGHHIVHGRSRQCKQCARVNYLRRPSPKTKLRYAFFADTAYYLVASQKETPPNAR